MNEHSCPQKKCNSPSRLLFYLVCANPNCINYDQDWHSEVTTVPRYKHETIGDQTFLGGYHHDGKYYDLYHSVNPLDDTECVEARFGDTLSDYICEELIFAALIENDVLHEAARRWNERLQK
jgi:hypothetical protein